MSVHYMFLEPVDVLFFRANKGFGDPGSYGESMALPWPSVAAGAIRSRILADSGTDLAAFARGEAVHPEIGRRDSPGSFQLAGLQLARRKNGAVEPLFPVPADLIVEKGGLLLARPTALPEALRSSYPLPLHPVVAQPKRGKPQGGLWLTMGGWRKYLDGGAPEEGDLLNSKALWETDPRTGIGLSAHTRSVEEGRLFTAEAVAFRMAIHTSRERDRRLPCDPERPAGREREGFDAGLLAAVSGCTPPRGGLVRLGADGRAAAVHPLEELAAPEPDWARMVREKKLRLILATPGLFREGWLPEGCREQNGEFLFDLHGVRGRLAAAAVARAEAVSGWDLAREQPKKAQRCAPAGSVYWLDHVEADEASLRALAERGLWPEPCTDEFRRAEGFNRIWIAPWAGENKGV
ncbi:MAG: CRISPR-associated protein Cmr3 [Bryobacteraceae bacterium]|nr:MAG: CRISPR-associated protein Cmr3 [Bryobacteraceae bacterium]